ncbi:MAG: DUF1947 domain-containing protein [Thermoplasmata archaeon]|nr:MAG: DUF1947 domain-containing protein [Thermoplasmata archaeon]
MDPRGKIIIQKLFCFMFKNRHALRKKEKKKVLEELYEQLGCKIEGVIEIADYKDKKVMLIDGKLHAIFINNKPFLTVAGLRKFVPTKKYVTVDDGAIKFITNGADIMTPGIVDADEGIKINELVWIRDERGMPIAIGKALMNGTTMKKEKKGKAVENIHYLGDEIWKMGMKNSKLL